MSVTQLGFVPVSAVHNVPKLRNRFVHLLKEITDACDLSNNFKAFLMMITKPTLFPQHFLNLSGLYILKKDDDIVALGIVAMMNGMNLDGIYVPERFRGKGYATTLLQNIASLYSDTDEICVYSAVAVHAIPVYEKAGWIAVNSPADRDGTIDHSPKQCVNAYSKMGKGKISSLGSMMRHVNPIAVGIRCLS
jgi:hypothetical protein